MYNKNFWLKRSSKSDDNFHKRAKYWVRYQWQNSPKPSLFIFLGTIWYTMMCKHPTDQLIPHESNQGSLKWCTRIKEGVWRFSSWKIDSIRQIVENCHPTLNFSPAKSICCTYFPRATQLLKGLNYNIKKKQNRNIFSCELFYGINHDFCCSVSPCIS